MSELSSNRSMQSQERSKPFISLSQFALVLLLLLVARILFSIVYEYRWYFPANFEESFFLSGRQETFHGWYRAAFYVHIVTGPFAILLALAMMFSGIKQTSIGSQPTNRRRFAKAHRWMGRSLALLVVFAVAPTGLVMSTQSLTGPIAGFGFAALSALTFASAIATGYFASKRNFLRHQRWANRCFVCLCSPLILRLSAGVTIVTNFESAWTYQLIAWLSWLGPLAIYEAYEFRQKRIRNANRRPPSFRIEAIQ